MMSLFTASVSISVWSFDDVEEMNDMLRKTTEYLEKQTAAFNEMLNTVIEETEEKAETMTAGLDTCKCSCKDCANPCSEKDKKDGEEEDSDEESDNGEGSDEAVSSEETEETSSDENVALADGENAPGDAEFDPASLPDEYSDPADLMKNIYYIQKRDIPVRKSDFSDPMPEGGITFRDEIGDDPKDEPDELPHDDDLEDIVSDVVEAS